MRKLVLVLCLCALAAGGSAAWASEPTGGTLSVDSGRGVVMIDLRGSVLGRLATTPDDDYVLLLDVVSTMLEDRSLVRVARVEERCGISTRALQRLFQRYVGVSPKWVLARYRIHDAVTDLDAGYSGTLADLAARYGWFDQAHFTREFTDLVGVPPSAYQRA